MPFDYAAAATTLSAIGVDLHRSKADPTVYSLMLDFTEFLENVINEGHIFYKLLRDKARKDIDVADKISGKPDPLTMLEKLLPQTPLGKRLQDVMNESFTTDPDNRRDMVTHLYMNLDLLGFKSDELTENHGYINLVADADHCYYASYCDIYVTNDKRAAAKAKAVITYMKLNVRVFDIVEFGNWIKE